MEKYRIQDDLYNYVNHEWIEKAVIPDDRPTTGGFSDLDKGVEELLLNDLNKMVENDEYPNEYLKNACSLFKLAKDTKKRNKNGIKPVLKDLKLIESLTDINAFNKKLNDLVIRDMPLPFRISLEADMKDTKHYAINIAGPSVILPDVTYYKENMKQQRDAILGIWTNMIKALLSYTSLSDEDKEIYISDALAFDEKLAKLVKSSEEWSEYTKVYNPMSLTKVNGLLKPIKFRKLIKNLFGEVEIKKIIVNEPSYLKSFNEVFSDDTFTLYKHWAYINTLLSASSYLSEDLRNIGGSYMRALSGVSTMQSADKFAYRIASYLFSEPIGLYYGEKYFGSEAKKDIIEMVNEIIATYKSRVKNSTILADSTKEKAILKLKTMKVKMGYPDTVNEIYNELLVNESLSLYQNIKELSKIRKLNKFSKINSEVDRDEWVMPGHMVNACYNPEANDITFPAAILQAPFYSIKQTRSQNLGGIGAVIGHEISHAFDNNGAKCDEYGNLNNWWTKEDSKNFKKRTKDMIKEFDGITLEYGKVNPSLIVSENIADNGGMAVTLEIMSKLENASYEEYFINWAKIWCIKAKPEYQALLLSVDVHAPSILRANMQPRNFDEWYKTFNVTKNDKMYIAPNKRVIIW